MTHHRDHGRRDQQQRRRAVGPDLDPTKGPRQDQYRSEQEKVFEFDNVRERRTTLAESREELDADNDD